MGRCLSIAPEGHAKVGPMTKSEISSSLAENDEGMGLTLAILSRPVAAVRPMRARMQAKTGTGARVKVRARVRARAKAKARARAGTMRRGHRVSVAKERPDRNVGGEGRLRGRDGGACSECYVNNFHPRGCSRPYEKQRQRRKAREKKKKVRMEAGGKGGDGAG